MSSLIFSIMAAETKLVIRCEECVCNHNQLSVLSGFPRFRKKADQHKFPPWAIKITRNQGGDKG
jgi:hypothetical protein